MHARATRGGDDQQRQTALPGTLDSVCDLFTRCRAHAAAHEGEVEADDDEGMARQPGFAPDDRLIGPGGGAALFDALGVGQRVFEAEDVLRHDRPVFFPKRTRFDQHRHSFGGPQPKVVAAAVAHTEGRSQAGGLERGVALGAGEPVNLFADAGTRRGQGDVPRFGTKHGSGRGPDGHSPRGELLP